MGCRKEMSWLILLLAGLFEIACRYSLCCLDGGIGAIGTVIFGIFVFKVPATLPRLIFVALY